MGTNTRQSACEGKGKFLDKETAWTAARRKEHRRAFYCHFCHHWHLATARKEEPAQREYKFKKRMMAMEDV